MNQVPPTSSTLSKHWITCPLEMMDEDKLLEEAIEAELSKIQISSSEIEESKEEELEEDILNESEPDADDLPTSVICYLEQIKQRSEAVEKLILQNLEQPEYVDNPVQKNCPGSEILMELASEFGEDQLKLKEKILAQIEEGEQRNDAESQKSIKSNFQIETTDQPLEDERISDDENIITSKCKEVEEHCWLTLQQWELEEEKRQKIKLIELKEQREKEKKQVEKEEERAKSRQQQFEEEVEKLTEERRQEQATLEEKIRQDQEALEKELKHHEVTTVTLQDLPGCSLSTLSQCPRLKSLILRNCGIETLDGVNNCKGLKYIDVQENNIKNIHSLEIEDLYVLLLSHNKISSMHGLGKCSNLCILELSHNNITRIGGLESLKKLQRLVIDHNQLISTKDLRETPTLIYLDCSFNHLSSIEGIDNCGLLQTLKLQNNNLSELPRFGNHVLLRDVCLDNNSISSLKELADYWLPMLQSLSLSQNSLTRLTAMSEFQMLERFNISDNRLSDLKSLLLSLKGCHSLLKLTLDENPFQQESGWRCSILKALPNLEMLNGERISSTDEASAERLREPSTGSFLAVCQAQLQHIELLHKRHKTELDTLNSLEIADLHCYHCEELMQLAEECRYAHEYGELCSSEGNKHPNCDKEEFHGGKQQKMLTINCANVNGQKTDHKVDSVQVQTPVTHKSNKQSNLSHTACQDSKDCNPRLLSVLERTAISLQDFRIKKGQIHSESNRMASESQNKECESHQQQISEDNMKSYAATVLQSHWRGYRIRRDILKFVILHNAASVIQSAWRDYCGRKKASFWNSARKTPQKWKLFDDREESRNQAVVIIQAHWRGYHLRKKLSHALAAVHIEEDDVFEEVNLNEFVFDEATLDKDWIKLDPQISSQTIPIKNTDLQSEILTRYTPDSFGLPRQPQLAWQGDDINTAKKYEQACSSPLQQYSPRETLSAPSEATFMSEKEEQISLEWGFKDLHTAHLMLKRAQKMKSKKTEAKKLQDPIARLALFKNKKIKYFPTKSSKKIHDCTKHFNVPEEPSHQDATSLETLQATYQWLHTQVTNREERHFRKKQHHRFLPEMNPEVLNGGHVQLMARPLGKESSGLDLVSVSRVSQQSSKFQANRWHSSGSSKTTVPPKTGSKPFKQERLSFRDHPMRLSTGWGTGKRKGKSF
ncbi:leucine-rich repeat and IQ domain-containing protein 1 isoform X6 [Narcine bancroftii]|uniref:leucine-rich repeat and IQ domain-containing protein 1 isoform X6 n=1 Tax=Narcine bancroftii TaxID=1343680 RepID=UPI00383104B2